MRLEYKNCIIELDNSKGKVYRDGKLMFKGDGYIAIKFMLQWTDNAKEVRERFKYQLSQREQCKWTKRDEEQRYEKRMKEEAERAKASFESKPQVKTKKNTTIWQEKLYLVEIRFCLKIIFNMQITSLEYLMIKRTLKKVVFLQV